MTRKPAPADPPAISFDPVPVRPRRDGWTPARQVAFIAALAECGCVADACRRVGMSEEGAYALVRRPDAQGFRLAWETALANAVRRISDAAFSRCIHGVAVPRYYKGELIGEHRRYDERLTTFLLRHRDPSRYGGKAEQDAAVHPEALALALGDALLLARAEAIRAEAGLPPMIVRPDPDAPGEWIAPDPQALPAVGTRKPLTSGNVP